MYVDVVLLVGYKYGQSIASLVILSHGKDKPESFAHTAHQHRNNLVEPTLPHRCHVAAHDQRELVPSRERLTKPGAIAQYANKTLPCSKTRGGRSS
jgi:hypothetical protein